MAKLPSPPPGRPPSSLPRHDTLREDNLLPAETAAADAQAAITRRETTRAVVTCRECGRPVERVEEWRPPFDADEAWQWAVTYRMKCTTTRESAAVIWSFCPYQGVAWLGGVRWDFERRKAQVPPIVWDGVGDVPAWDGSERRRAA